MTQPEAWHANEDYLAWLSREGWIDGYTPRCDDYTYTSLMDIVFMYEAWKAGYIHRKNKDMWRTDTQQGSQ